MANRIMLNETSYHGAGAVKEIATEAKARAFQKAFICSDPDLIKFGVTKKVTDVLDSEDLAYEIYSDIKANPTIENVQQSASSLQILNLRMSEAWKVLLRPKNHAFQLSLFLPQQVPQLK